ncbi:hypothetical protein UFOVP1604_153 [uncultured Caudovirales phage]|uniref:Uncharacterized protein n=1 Tax=uncultured Caudovirales phage TaxID=2100421 RepID=A0A6J5SUZ7_9CAUD|nr:hypothetical protein UFOVP1604_153 [uncultured Caudovirales phage]
MEAEDKLTKTQIAIDQARLIMESFDPGGALTVGYDQPMYTLTSEQMGIIAGALYLADCDLSYLK